jgi:hypothetical protein
MTLGNIRLLALLTALALDALIIAGISALFGG